MTIKEKQEEIIAEFEMFSDWMEKYEHIIEIGKDLPLIDDALKIDENIIKGCQSRVWLSADKDGETINFTADSDAIITKGLIALMIRVLSGHTSEEILEADLFFIDQIGLKEHLSPTRSNGLLSMIKQIKMYAIAYKAKGVNS